MKRSRGPIERYFHRNQLLQAAARVFATRGLREATIEDILAAADVSRRTFYQYFRSKDELLVALFSVSCELLLQALREQIHGGPDATRVERCVDVYLAFRQRAGAIMHELEAEALRPGSPLEALRRELLDAASRELAGEIRDAASGRHADPLVVHGVLVALEGISHRMKTPDPYSESRARDAMLRIARAALARPHDAVPALPMIDA
jgi:AcrR family transcriptional regulator